MYAMCSSIVVRPQPIVITEAWLPPASRQREHTARVRPSPGSESDENMCPSTSGGSAAMSTATLAISSAAMT